MRERRPRVLLADDHPMMLEGLRKLLSPDFEVVGAATNGRALLEAAEIRRPDLVITDISMPVIDGIAATRQLRELVPEARVLILSIHTEPSLVRAAFDAGAYGYLTKNAAPEEIGTAVREVLKGHFYLSPAVTQAVMGLPKEDTVERHQTPRPKAGEALTPREMDIVRLVGKGLGNKEIAHQLGVSVTTIRTHLNRIYEKKGQVSRVELALSAARCTQVVM
jgi:DNA-binding NarL/FixJ family response regulator